MLDGLDESGMSPPLICGCVVDPDVDTRRDPAISSGTFWDCSPYSDFAQAWLGNDTFSAGYGREKDPTLPIASQSFSDILDFNFESLSPLFAFREPFPVAPSVKQTPYRDDPWGLFLSPDLSSPTDDTCSPSSLVQGTGKENIPPSPNSPTLSDFAAFRGTASLWTDSLSAKFGTDSPQKPNLSGDDISPAARYPPQPPQGRRKGLFGWGDTSRLHPPIPVPSIFHQNRPRRPRSSSRSSDVDGVLDPHSLAVDSSPPIRKRPRQSPPSHGSSDIETESSSPDSSDEGSLLDGGGSDDYQPSPSPSPKFERFKAKLPPCPKTPPKPAVRSLKRSKTAKSKRAGTKGSAALALAVVTQIGEARREAQTLKVSLDPDSLDPVRVYHEGSYVVKKRKNQPIPVPVPVPNLHKKSRGRKVPFVADSTANTVSAPLVDGGQLRKPAKSRRKAQAGSGSGSDESGANRSYVCVVPGCGKCFVRGEHLKRHVRSIHTNDKPHLCPFDGCHKSFSRRDNLGQHVRVHLQP